MRTLITVLLMLLTLTACAPASPAAPPPVPSPTRAIAPTLPPVLPTPAAVQPTSTGLPLPSSTPPPASSPTPLPVLQQSDGNLTVQVFSPEDLTVSEASYRIAGKAPAGTVVSIDDEILVVDASGQFSGLAALEEGPNLVELVASDDSGQEVSFLITITYEAPE